jgi:hypothetical protein
MKLVFLCALERTAGFAKQIYATNKKKKKYSFVNPTGAIACTYKP